MQVLAIFAHPLDDSLCKRLFDEATNRLSSEGHSVTIIDLYKDGFNPVLSKDEREQYFDDEFIPEELKHYQSELMKADTLLFCFPTWCLGPPAILKGFFDRLMKPGVSFIVLPSGDLAPNLIHIERVIALVTYGRARPILFWFGDPPRKMMTRYLKWFVSKTAKIHYLPVYNLHKPSELKIKKAIEKVRKAVSPKTRPS